MLKQFENKKYIIWDWNGTLLDDLEYTVSIGNKVLELNGKKTVSVEYYLENFCFPVSEYYRKLGFNVDDKGFFSKLCHDFVGLYMEGVTECKIKPEMLAIIEALNSKGIKQSVLSASEQNVLNTMLTQQNVKHFFEHTYGLSDKAATCKRERGRELIKKINWPNKNEFLLVGDTVHDLEVGKDNGIDVLLVAHGHNSLQRLQEHSQNILIL